MYAIKAESRANTNVVDYAKKVVKYRHIHKFSNKIYMHKESHYDIHPFDLIKIGFTQQKDDTVGILYRLTTNTVDVFIYAGSSNWLGFVGEVSTKLCDEIKFRSIRSLVQSIKAVLCKNKITATFPVPIDTWAQITE
jgi:hypothetical protein